MNLQINIGQWLLGVIIPMVIHFGVEVVLAKFPSLPTWLVIILKDLEGAKQAAGALATAEEQDQAIAVARAKAAAQVHLACNGAACPVELQQNKNA